MANKVLSDIKRIYRGQMFQWESEKPQHKHDCESCEFLGTFVDRKNVYDLYYHDSPTAVLRTFVARYGNDEKYISGIGFISAHYALQVALARKILKDYS